MSSYPSYGHIFIDKYMELSYSEFMKNPSRKHYIDNLWSLTILLLFPVHTFIIWNDFGSRFYIWVKESRLLSTLIVLINPWFMPLLFVLAGISARYGLEKRTVKEFVVQRVRAFSKASVFCTSFYVFTCMGYVLSGQQAQLLPACFITVFPITGICRFILLGRSLFCFFL